MLRIEERKVYKIGGGSYLISLPREWVRRHNCRSVVVIVLDNAIIICPSNREAMRMLKEVKVLA